MAQRCRKFTYGFSPAKGSDGKPLGHSTLKITIKNAYELLGLRKPAHGGLGRP